MLLVVYNKARNAWLVLAEAKAETFLTIESTVS